MMNIVIDLINYPQSGGANYDWRYSMWVKICKELENKGHKVQSVNQTGVSKSPFETYEPGKLMDLYICHTPYGCVTRQKRRAYHLKNNKQVVCYDHGWLPKSLLVDRGLGDTATRLSKLGDLFGDSFYVETIKNDIQECPSLNASKELINYFIDKNISKRQQSRKDKIPNIDYIFIPGQVLFDASVVHYSYIGMKELIIKTCEFAFKHKLHVVYKPHPGATNFKTHGKKELESFTRNLSKQNTNFHIINTSIYDLMSKALFTSCVNSGSIIDNIVTQTPVYCCGKSFFYQSDTVLYDPIVHSGLSKILNGQYDSRHMRQQQLRMLWWLSNNLIQESMNINQQIQLLEKHSGMNF